MTGTSENKGFLEMSDEDFLKVNSPPQTQAASEPVVEDDKDRLAASAVVVDDAGSDAAPVEEQPTEAEANAESVAEDKDPGADDTGAAAVAAGSIADGTAKPAAKTDEKPVEGEVKADKVVEEPVNYEGFFKQIMTPFKANGRTIELKTPEEAIRLMQMGAGYGRKIQDLQPHLKVLRMLEKNDLLDESRLSFLIDVNQKNPDAIKKIIKDSGIDPLDLDIQDNVSYTPHNHAVTDKEMEFNEALTDVQGHATGQETLRLINQTWDKESKAVLWDSPQILGVIQSQRDNGVYDQIVSEIDRQKLLGQIPHSTPFLHAYKLAGDHLQTNNGFKISEQAAQIQTQSGITPQPQVIATRTAAPKAQVQNSDKAAAASQTKTSSTRKASTNVNPLDLADDVFMKQFEGRI